MLILLLWIYLSSAALLIGGELNSEIENAAANADAPTPSTLARRSRRRHSSLPDTRYEPRPQGSVPLSRRTRDITNLTTVLRLPVL